MTTSSLSASSCVEHTLSNTGDNQDGPPSLAADKSGYAKVNGLEMYYEIYGEGKPLVLIHGGGSTIETTFGRIIPELSKHRQLIAVELQAHGHTKDIDRPETFENDADDVAALLAFLHIQKADIFGFSNGGSTALQLAIKHPASVNKIIAASAVYKRDGLIPHFFESIEKATLKDMPVKLQEAYLKINPDSSGLLKMFERDRQRMVTFKDWQSKDLQLISAPTLILNADKDVVLPEHAVEMYRLIPHCRLAILPGEHGGYIGEITTLSNKKAGSMYCLPLIEEFLDN